MGIAYSLLVDFMNNTLENVFGIPHPGGKPVERRTPNNKPEYNEQGPELY